MLCSGEVGPVAWAVGEWSLWSEWRRLEFFVLLFFARGLLEGLEVG